MEYEQGLRTEDQELITGTTKGRIQMNKNVS
jgi:hypothetical protein